MPDDFYQVEVLYLINPHLIWVERRDPPFVSIDKEDLKLEQIGIYGLLPLETTFDLECDKITIQPCKQWLPAAAALMREFLSYEEELWFSPVHLDRRSSIFDDNIHKFGDILIKKSGGKFKSLSKVLRTSGFANYDACLFHQYLSHGVINTKLSNIETQRVVAELTKYYENKNVPKKKWQKPIEKQITIFRASQELQQALTMTNVDRHNERMRALLEKKCKDLELCKGVDEESLGRGSSRKTKENKKSPVEKRLELLSSKKNKVESKDMEDTRSHEQVFEDTKKFLEAKATPYSKKIYSKTDAQKSQILLKVMSKTAKKEKQQNLAKRLVDESEDKTKPKNSVAEETENIGDSSQLSNHSEVSNSGSELEDIPKNVEKNLKELKSISELAKEIKCDGSLLVPNSLKIRTMGTTGKKPSTTSITNQMQLNKAEESAALISKDDQGAQTRDNNGHRSSKGKTIKKMSKAETIKSLLDSQVTSSKDNCGALPKSKSPKRCAFKPHTTQRDQRVPDLPNECEAFESPPASKHVISKLIDQYKSTGSIHDNMIQKALSKCKDGVTNNKEAIDALKHCEHKLRNEMKELNMARKSTKHSCSDSLLGDAQTTTKSKLKKKGKKCCMKNFPKKVVFGPPGIDKNTICRVPPINNLDEDENNSKEDPSASASLPSDRSNAFDVVEFNTRIELDQDAVAAPATECNENKQQTRQAKDKKATSSSNGSVWEKRLKLHKELAKNKRCASLSCDTTNKEPSNLEDKTPPKNFVTKSTKEESDDIMSEVTSQLALNNNNPTPTNNSNKNENYVNSRHELVIRANPFQNIDPNLSVFVDKLVTPIMMVHSKLNKRFAPESQIRDIHFSDHVRCVLKNLGVSHPMMLQTIAWPSILRGYSVFMVGAANSGKTMGYLPAVCRFVTDQCENDSTSDGIGPFCIIVCATSLSVSDVEYKARMLLGCNEKVVSCYYGHDEVAIATSLLNGCDLLICTPPALVRLFQMSDFGVDLRRLATFVLDDCERLSEVYQDEIKFCLYKIKEMLKSRVNKELKVQYVVASRIWCEFMEPLAKKAPDSVVCIGAFQECVLYSKANMKVSYVKLENKLDHLMEFLQEIDPSKRTVVVCDSDEEVDFLNRAIQSTNYFVFASNSKMTVEDLYNLSNLWVEFREPMMAPVLICCDSNLYHMNVVNAHYLVQYSMPSLYSTFCRRFASLNESYPSIFTTHRQDVKILILLSEDNVEQFPKIVNFVKRCTNNVPEFLDGICTAVLTRNNVTKAELYVPLCSALLSLGRCSAFYQCSNRHIVHKDYDKPKEWMPTSGEITFKILHYHSATLYSVRLMTHIVNGSNEKYPSSYSGLSLKMGVHYSNYKNKIMFGVPEIGDVCAVALANNLYARCRVIKIIDRYQRGNPKNLLVNLIDEEKTYAAADTDLYHLPDEFKDINTYVAHVRLANIQPRDKDVVFSHLARKDVRDAVNQKEGTYMKGQIALTVGNCIFVETLEACQDLKSLNETVVTYNVKRDLLEKHAEENPDHLSTIVDLCRLGGLEMKLAEKRGHVVEKLVKEIVEPSWAYLDEDLNMVDCGSIEDPGTLFIRLTKFEDCMRILIKDIQQYAAENPVKIQEFTKGDIVLAEYPDDCMFERARIDEIGDETIKCFFVDQGEWRHLKKDKFLRISDTLITQLPFQTIECRLVGIKPPGRIPDQWPNTSSNWLFDRCAETASGDSKQLYVKYFTKESAQFTGGQKYGVVLIDTYGDEDLNINQAMIDLNLASEVEDENEFIDFIKLKKEAEIRSHDEEEDDDDSWEKVSKYSGISNHSTQNLSASNLLFSKPIRSVPLVGSDDNSDVSEKWDINMTEDITAIFNPLTENDERESKPKLLAIENNKEQTVKKINVCDTIAKNVEEYSRQLQLGKTNPGSSTELDSDDLSLPETRLAATEPVAKTLQNVDETQLRKPKVIWRQTKTNVTIKIQLIGVEHYDLELHERSIKFTAKSNETDYGFVFDLYAVIDSKNATHSNKGQYIFVKFNKIMKKNWLTLTKDCGIRKWIVYDVDSIDTSSDEEEAKDENLVNAVKNMHCKADTESESDDEFHDDVKYGSYKN